MNYRTLSPCMLRFVLLILLLPGGYAGLHAQTRINLYEDGKVPNSIPMTSLVDTLRGKSRLTGHDTIVILPRTIMPTLTIFPPREGLDTRTAVVVCPGGSYRGVAEVEEGIPAAKKLAEAGVTVFLLHYRVPRKDLMIDKEIGPLQDGQSALRYVREHAAEYGIDPSRVGIMGFSAGGHLVSTLATHFDHSYIDNPLHTNLRPDFVILAYPVISFADSLTHLMSRKNLIGPDITEEKIREYSNELHVSPLTPPTFIVHAFDDTVVKVANSIYFIAALQQQHVPVESFFYARGGHGFGVHNPTVEAQWIDPCIEWIKRLTWGKKP